MERNGRAIKRRCLAVGAVLALLASVPRSLTAQTDEAPAGVSAADSVRLRELYRLAEELGDEIWPGFSRVPMPILLVTADREFLVDWPGSLPEGFDDGGIDERLGRTVRVRPRHYSPGMEASFPAFGSPAVIVFGTAEATGRNSNEWVLTMLHEHLHQLQYAAPGYHEEAERLDLAKSDPSGMWMLNYPFPYEDEAVGTRFGELAAALREALDGRGSTAMAWSKLRTLLEALEPADARYLSFQLWQEGVGRFIELRAAEIAGSSFTPSAEFAALPDAIEWPVAARAERERLRRALDGASLAEHGRVAFYPVGSALALLLDREAPGWRERYLEEKFDLSSYRSIE